MGVLARRKYMECAITLQIIAGAKLYNVLLNHPLYGWIKANDKPMPLVDAKGTITRIKNWKVKQKPNRDYKKLAG